ncbi:hypothetical protein [Ruegeria sp. HKCCD8929]|uniref:ORC-CDC6 family AAA ATPase n=1 Tax=Ruegeria sp. HKCCD8929 TaxID=2683006 RepID=UPI00148801FC|nr:hypothetical protein [Ruegeria sp. HKCCD8929]
MISISENPFRVHTPEALSAQEVVQLYVSEMPGADTVHSPGHTMIVGARGSGKSMMLRYLEPDCQSLRKQSTNSSAASYSDIGFFSIYLTIKQTDLIYPELQSLEGTFADRAINEHFLILVILLKTISRCQKKGTLEFLRGKTGNIEESELYQAISSQFDFGEHKTGDYYQLFSFLKTKLAALYSTSLTYLDRILEDPTTTPKFEQNLLRFSTFLLPILEGWRSLPGMPDDGQFFVIIDDADYLNEMQTRILNTYISNRLDGVYFKVSAEVYKYKTFNTLDRRRIEVSHDFSEIHTIDIYTSDNARFYKDRVTRMVNKRLELHNYQKSKSGKVANADEFFPEDSKQKAEISKIRNEIRVKESKIPSRAKRVRDDMYRYSVPEYIRGLGGTRKSRSSYSYSGYDQLINISSGVPRYFLDAAYIMFDRMKASGETDIRFISPTIQNVVVRELAGRVMMDELERLKLSEAEEHGASDLAKRLHNLIASLGALFEKLLIDPNSSERRYFSFAISDFPDEDVSAVLKFGVQNSMFTRTSIGRKEGFGRTDRYILTRRVAPYFNLDPNGFSAYKFLKNSVLRTMMLDPDAYRKNLRAQGHQASDSDGPLFDWDTK